jgi:hypothetical protein
MSGRTEGGRCPADLQSVPRNAGALSIKKAKKRKTRLGGGSLAQISTMNKFLA